MSEALRAEFQKRGESRYIQSMCVFPGPISTGLFKGFSVPGIPVMTGEYVAQKIIEGMEKGKANVYLPPMVGMAVAFKGLLPPFVFDFFLQLQNNAMDAFNPAKANTAFKSMSKT